MLNRRDLLKLGAGLGGLAAAPGCRSAERRPNVIYMITDDQRWDLMSCAGHPILKTPNMDRIAHGGARFTSAYVVSSLCSPTRASFLSGLHAHQHGILSNGNLRIERFFRQAKTFPQLLHEDGYKTAYIGKYHIGRDGRTRPGYDHWMVLPWQGLYQNPRYKINGEEKYFEGWVDDLTGDFASEWLEETREPFCLCVGFKSPHAQQTPPARYRDLYSDVLITPPDTYEEDYAVTGKPNVVSQSLLRVTKFFDGPLRKGSYDAWVKDFYRCLVGVDDNVGKILDALDRKGVAEDTVVVFVGDNGFFLGEHGLSDKRFPYEEGLRVPILMRYPRKIPAGLTPGQMVLSTDVSPTVLGWCGVKPPDETEGEDLAPLLGDPAAPGRDAFVYEYDDPAFNLDKQGFLFPHILALRTRRYKLIDHMDSIADRDELYDLQQDPKELRNRVDDPEMAQVLAELRARLEQWKADTGWQPPVPVKRWKTRGPGAPGAPFEQRKAPAPPPDDAEWQDAAVDAEGGIVLRADAPSETWLAVDIDCADARCGAALFFGCDGVFTALLGERRLRWTERAPKRFFRRQHSFDLPLEQGKNRLLVLVRHGPEPVRIAGAVQTVGWRGRAEPLVAIL